MENVRAKVPPTGHALAYGSVPGLRQRGERIARDRPFANHKARRSRPIARIDGDHLDLTHRALHGFSAIGTIIVATIVVTGLANSWFMVGIGNLASLATTLYGQLLLAKLALFAAMLGLASLNRFRLTPAFEQSIAAADHRGALAALRRSLAAETACVMVILALVAWLGTLAPPGSAM